MMSTDCLVAISDKYLQLGNGFVNGSLGFFSMSGITDAWFGRESSPYLYPIEGILTGDLFAVTTSAYDGNTKDVFDAFKLNRRFPKTQLMGVIGGAVKGINGFVAVYSLMQKIMGDDPDFNYSYAAIALFCAVPYWLMETVKIVEKLNLLASDWAPTKTEYLELSRVDQAALTAHFISAFVPAMLLTAAFLLSFNDYGDIQFWTTLGFSFAVSIIMAIGTTNQYGIKWTGAEGRLPDSSQGHLVNNDQAPFSENAVTTARWMANVGTSIKFLLTVLSMLSMSEPFSNMGDFKKNLNLPKLHDLTDHEFDSAKIWAPLLVFSIIIGAGYFKVQLKRLQVKSEQNIPKVFRNIEESAIAVKNAAVACSKNPCAYFCNPQEEYQPPRSVSTAGQEMKTGGN